MKSLDRVLAVAWEPGAGLSRVVAYSEAERPATAVPDYTSLGMALLDAWEATGELRFFTVAEQMAEVLLERFYDGAEGGFFDTEQGAGAGPKLGALAARRKPLQDAPTPAGNAVAASLLLRLHALTGREIYRGRAEDTSVADFCNHIDYVVRRIGLAHCGISSDFDGGGAITGWSDASQSLAVTEELVARGYGHSEVAALWGGNFLRVMRAAEAVAG